MVETNRPDGSDQTDQTNSTPPQPPPRPTPHAHARTRATSSLSRRTPRIAHLTGLSSIFYIFLLMVLMYYVAAILGMNFFRSNDPWHWKSLDVSAVTLFRMSTLEDWSDIMYINMYGCLSYGYDANEMMRNMCNNTALGFESKGQPAISVMFCICFVMLSSLIMLSLFVGVVTTSMESASSAQTAEKDRNQRMARLLKLYPKCTPDR